MDPKFYLWCRWGRAALEARTQDEALELGMLYAVSNGLTVCILNRDDQVIAQIPPAVQADEVWYVVSGQMARDAEALAEASGLTVLAIKSEVN